VFKRGDAEERRLKRLGIRDSGRSIRNPAGAPQKNGYGIRREEECRGKETQPPRLGSETPKKHLHVGHRGRDRRTHDQRSKFPEEKNGPVKTFRSRIFSKCEI